MSYILLYSGSDRGVRRGSWPTDLNFCFDIYNMIMRWGGVGFTQKIFTVPAIPILPIGGSFPWSISNVVPCKNYHCVPLHETNIPSIDNSLSRDSKTLVFALVWVVSYALAPKRKINTGPHASWCSALVSHPHRVVYGIFLKNRGGDSTLTISRMSH